MGGKIPGKFNVLVIILYEITLTCVHYEQNIADLNYDDPVAVDDQIPNNWWLEYDKCKYILSVLVHKDNKDISAAPVKLPSGPSRSIVRDKKRKSVSKERADDKAEQPVVVLQRDGSKVLEKYGDVDHHLKKAKVDGMRSVIDKNKVDAIMSQIAVMKQMEDVYVSRLGRNEFERQLVHLANQMPGMLPMNDSLSTPRAHDN